MDPSMGWALSWWIAWFIRLMEQYTPFNFDVESKQRSGSIPGVTRQLGSKPRQPKTWKQSEGNDPLPDPPIDKRLTKASAILD